MHEPFVELRGDVPREYAETLDAIAFARGNGANRMTILREVLADAALALEQLRV